MPELPDVELYVTSLRRLLGGRRLIRSSIRSPFVLRTFTPPLGALDQQVVTEFSRLGKRIVWHFESGHCLVFHLMIAGRFHWRKPERMPRQKSDLAAFQFEHGTMMLTEASKEKRASMHLVASVDETGQFRRGGLELDQCTLREFTDRLLKVNRTLKRALTDPENFSGIGNAYSDEILHAAGLSPLKRTSTLSDSEVSRLFDATVGTLQLWTRRLVEQTGEAFPEKVTAFHPQMMAHGKFGQPCGVCGTTIQRIVYVSNECNYCPKCQTGGKLLADRSLSRLLKDEWPKNINELD